MAAGEAGGEARASAPRFAEPPAFSRRLFRFFAPWLRRHFAKNFHAVRLSLAGAPPEPDGRPLVFYSNHPSWWDPVLYMVLADACLPGLAGYGPMEAAELERYGILKRLGVFPVDSSSSRAGVQFLRSAQAVLGRERSSLWLTPEGEFADARERPLRLKSGLAHLAKRLDDAVLVPLALEYPFWTESKPEALARFGAPIETKHHAGLDVEAWTRLLSVRLEETMNELASEAISRRPERFRTLVGGEAGVGGVYDLWRRLKAALTGRDFRAEHGREP
jgi:1-acyl-sn-glycerol-3-phosphate acyltransferase